MSENGAEMDSWRPLAIGLWRRTGFTPLVMTCLGNLSASRDGPSAVCYRLGSPSAERMITGALSEPLGTVGELMA